MANNSSQFSCFLARTLGHVQFATLALAGVVAFASVAAAADPVEVAVVESISGNSSGVKFLDYLRLGQVIRLDPHETIVLSYRTSCVREMITAWRRCARAPVPGSLSSSLARKALKVIPARFFEFELGEESLESPPRPG